MGQIWDKFRAKVGKFEDKVWAEVGQKWDTISYNARFKGRTCGSSEFCPKFLQILPSFAQAMSDMLSELLLRFAGNFNFSS